MNAVNSEVAVKEYFQYSSTVSFHVLPYNHIPCLNALRQVNRHQPESALALIIRRLSPRT